MQIDVSKVEHKLTLLAASKGLDVETYVAVEKLEPQSAEVWMTDVYNEVETLEFLPARPFIAFLLVVCTFLSVAFAFVFLRPEPESVTQPRRLLGVYVEGFIGGGGPQGINLIHPDRDFPESMGWPVPIGDDGTISLPAIQPVYVQGKSLGEIQELVNRAYNKLFPSQNISVRVCMFPERQYWKQETWDRIRFYDQQWDKLKRMLGMSSNVSLTN